MKLLQQLSHLTSTKLLRIQEPLQVGQVGDIGVIRCQNQPLPLCYLERFILNALSGDHAFASFENMFGVQYGVKETPGRRGVGWTVGEDVMVVEPEEDVVVLEVRQNDERLEPANRNGSE